MAPVNKICKDCGARMKELRHEEIAGTVYHHMKCDECKKEVARREE
ncbi:hypothetical protein GOV09_06550 [Candidatus Woesearchaeota archaeon]|nr:hypothetical protein [Candidatus Woesearchaeota archaeon]